MSFCIYLHKNKINNKCYVGQTNQIPKYRWGSDGRNYKSGYFHSAIVCYGWDNFEHIILADNLSAAEANELEQYYIKLYKANDPAFGYNCDIGGNNKTPNELTRQKQSKSAQSRKPVSQETKDKLSANAKGLIRSADAKINYSSAAAKREKLKKDLHINKYRSVHCIEADLTFKSVADAARWCGLAGGSGIAIACKNPLNRSAGIHPDTGEKLHWEYKN